MATSYFILKAGIAPPELHRQPEAVRMTFWGRVVELGLKRKDWELARGLNAKGEPLPGIAPATRKHRKSEMTPSGRGDPRAPYLMPGRGLSRTRSLLAGKPHADYAEFFWRYDAWTGDQWGKILAHHARRGKAYDVVGLSPKGIAWVAAQAQKRWRQYLAGTYVEPIPQTQSAAATLPFETPGRTNLDFATFGIGGDEASARRAIAEGRSSGFLGAEEWARYFRQSRPSLQPRAGQAPSVTRGASNVLLQSVWNVPRTPPPTPMRRAAMPPVAPPRPRRPATPPAPAPAPAVAFPMRPAVEMVKAYGVVSEADVGTAREAYASLPAWARMQLERNFSEVAVAEKTADVLPDELLRQSAAGYREGADWSNASGVYHPVERKAIACRTWIDIRTGEVARQDDEEFLATVYHEIGHAVDYSYGMMPSRDKPFREAYDADVAAMSEGTRFEMAYFLQTEHGNGPKEVFAEAFAQEIGRARTIGFDLARVFPRTVAYLRTIFKDGPT